MDLMIKEQQLNTANIHLNFVSIYLKEYIQFGYLLTSWIYFCNELMLTFDKAFEAYHWNFCTDRRYRWRWDYIYKFLKVKQNNVFTFYEIFW